MKKIVALLIVVALILGMFSGCDSESNLSTLAYHELPSYDEVGDGYESNFTEDNRNIDLIYAEPEEHQDYIDLLLDSGFKKYAENKIGDNCFTTLINQKTTVTVNYRACKKELKIMSEPRGDLYPREKDNKYKNKKIQTLLTGFKGENVVAYSGMGIIIRLCDGSFLIIDGGAGDPDSVDSNKLMNILREQSPEGTEKPVIAAWILTHSHNDHIGVFNEFADDFHDQVVIEGIYYNYPPTNRMTESHSRFMSALENYYADVPTYRSITGQKYYIRNAVIDMLFSYEDHLPQTFNGGGMSDLNQASLMFKIDIEGQSIMITGDGCDTGMQQMVLCYGDYLKSDIFQMAHHGQNGLVDFNIKVDPTYVILPVAFPAYETHYTKIDANCWLVDSKNVRQFIDFAKTNVTIPLPYNPADDEIIDRIPNWSTNLPTYPTLKAEVVKPAKKVPEAWFDLGFKDGVAYDKAGNLTVTMPKGSVEETTVKHNKKKYNVTGFVGDEEDEGLLLNLPFNSAEEYTKWLMGGSTFEVLLQINKYGDERIDNGQDITGNASLFGNFNFGGVSLCGRDYQGKSQLQFVMGTTMKNGVTNPWGNYACAARRWMNEGPVFMEEGKVIHCVGTYDKKTNTMNIYYNGILAASGSFGKGELDLGLTEFNVLGIGIDPSSYLSSFGKTGSFTLLGAKLYKTALSESEVLAEYNNCIKGLKK